MTQRDMVEVWGQHEEEVVAADVDLLVMVDGSSLVAGTTTLSKAKEVAALVAALRAAGLEERAIEVVSVQAEVKSGLLTKSSSATYELKVRCDDLEQLPALLGAITGAKNVRLGQFVWRYPGDAANEGELLARASANGQVKAAAIAQALSRAPTARERPTAL